jgi:hypothetical protein
MRFRDPGGLIGPDLCVALLTRFRVAGYRHENTIHPKTDYHRITIPVSESMAESVQDASPLQDDTCFRKERNMVPHSFMLERDLAFTNRLVMEYRAS